jgi:hypothetical protein
MKSNPRYVALELSPDHPYVEKTSLTDVVLDGDHDTMAIAYCFNKKEANMVANALNMLDTIKKELINQEGQN